MRSPSNKRGGGPSGSGGMILSSKAMARSRGKPNDSVERNDEIKKTASGSFNQLKVPKRSSSKEQVKTSSRNQSRDSKDPKEEDVSYSKKKEYMLKCILKI